MVVRKGAKGCERVRKAMGWPSVEQTGARMPREANLATRHLEARNPQIDQAQRDLPLQIWFACSDATRRHSYGAPHHPKPLSNPWALPKISRSPLHWSPTPLRPNSNVNPYPLDQPMYHRDRPCEFRPDAADCPVSFDQAPTMLQCMHVAQAAPSNTKPNLHRSRPDNLKTKSPTRCISIHIVWALWCQANAPKTLTTLSLDIPTLSLDIPTATRPRH